MYSTVWLLLGCTFLFVIVFSLYRNGILLKLANKYGVSESYLSFEHRFVGGPDWGRPSIEKPLPLVEFSDGSLPARPAAVSSAVKMEPTEVSTSAQPVAVPSARPSEVVAAVASPSAKAVEVASAKRSPAPPSAPVNRQRDKTIASTPEAPAPAVKAPVAKAPAALPPLPVEQDANPLKAAIRSAINKK
jgi:hypothetical protein